MECLIKSIFECVHMEAGKWYYCMLRNLNEFYEMFATYS